LWPWLYGSLICIYMCNRSISTCTNVVRSIPVCDKVYLLHLLWWRMACRWLVKGRRLVTGHRLVTGRWSSEDIPISSFDPIIKLNTTIWWNIMAKNKTIRVITKLPNSEQSYKGKVKTHKYINRQNQSTTGKLWKP
jgi:hypothetical protein